jgi:hypothetical protein
VLERLGVVDLVGSRLVENGKVSARRHQAHARRMSAIR